MSKIEVSNAALADTAGASKSGKSAALRLDKQTIRTLTGAELKLVGGGLAIVCAAGSCCTCHSKN